MAMRASTYTTARAGLCPEISRISSTITAMNTTIPVSRPWSPIFRDRSATWARAGCRGMASTLPMARMMPIRVLEYPRSSRKTDAKENSTQYSIQLTQFMAAYSPLYKCLFRCFMGHTPVSVWKSIFYTADRQMSMHGCRQFPSMIKWVRVFQTEGTVHVGTGREI